MDREEQTGLRTGETGTGVTARRRRKLLIAAIVAAGVVVLAGGGTAIAVAVAGSPPPAPPGPEATTSSPTPAPTGGPVPFAAVPGLTLQARCADLVSGTELAVFETSMQLVADSAEVAEYWDALWQQADVLSCRWAPNAKHYWTDDRLGVHVVVDGARYYAEERRHVIDTQYTRTDTSGDRSHFQCGYWGVTGWTCSGRMLVGDDMVYLDAADRDDATGIGDEGVSDRMDSLMDAVAAAIEVTPEADREWKGADDAFDGALLCGEEGAVLVDRALEGEWHAGGFGWESPTDVAVDRTPIEWCEYFTEAGPSHFQVSVAVGANWFFRPEILNRWADGYDAVGIPGADGAYVGCSDTGWCTVLGSYGGSLVQVGSDDHADVVEWATRLFAALDAAQ